MSGLARMLHSLGIRDFWIRRRQTSPVTDGTQWPWGLPVRIGQDGSGLPEDLDLLVTSAAIAPDHPDVLAAEQRGVEIRTYAEVLGMVQEGRTGRDASPEPTARAPRPRCSATSSMSLRVRSRDSSSEPTAIRSAAEAAPDRTRIPDSGPLGGDPGHPGQRSMRVQPLLPPAPTRRSDVDQQHRGGPPRHLRLARPPSSRRSREFAMKLVPAERW